MTDIDVTMIVNGHREGVLAFPTLRSLAMSLRRAADAGLRCDVQAILDKPDRSTEALFTAELAASGVVGSVAPTHCEVVQFGDLGLSRNRGVELSRGQLVGFLDADNILDVEWIRSAAEFLASTKQPTVARPAYIVFFGQGDGIWEMISSSTEIFRPEVLACNNLWDAFGMAPRSVYEQQPYLPTDGKAGIGPEDWHWNCEAVSRGVLNIAVPETAFFYRVKRTGSLNATHGSSLLPPTSLLTDRTLATVALSRSAPPDDTVIRAGRLVRPEPTPEERMLKRILNGAQERGEALREIDQHPVGWDGESGQAEFNPVHYRALYSDMAHLTDAQCTRHFQQMGRGEGRIGRLTPAQVTTLRPTRFQPDDYRLRYPDMTRATAEDATRHFLDHGLVERRTGVFSPAERKMLHADRFDMNDYKARYGDLSDATRSEAVWHWLKYGVREKRKGRFRSAVTRACWPSVPPMWLLRTWRVAHEIEPAIRIPRPREQVGVHPGPVWAIALPPEVTSYWSLVDALPERIDYLFFAPWLKMGGGDLVLLQYLEAVRDLDPEASIALITTEHEESPRLDQLPDGVRVAEFNALVDPDLSPDARAFILGTLIMQHAPHTVHALNSNACFDAIDRFGKALRTQTNIFLSSWVVERQSHGEMASWLFGRDGELLDSVSAILTDHAALGTWFADTYRTEPSKFVVRRQAVADPYRPRDELPVGQDGSVKLLWTGRFTHQKRLDVLAEIAVRLAGHTPAVNVHFYGDGERVDGELVVDELIEAALDTLDSAGAVHHPAYTNGFSSLPLEEYAFFIMTSETEGTPNALLEALASGVPAIAPMVGGIPEFFGSSVGFPISRTDAVDEYVEAIGYALGNYGDAVARARRARELIDQEFTRERFIGGVAEISGYIRPDAAETPRRPE